QHLTAPVALRRQIRTFRPDVVYSALHMSNAIAWMATRGTRTPLAWGLRASEDDLNLKRAVPFQFCRLVSRTVPLAIANARAGRVLWLGHRAATAPIYPGFDLFCLPSLTEGFPNVVGEAMACGLDCVVTDVGDAPLIVGGAGRVVPPGDPVKLAENIIWATEHSADRDGDARRQRILDAFSVARMVRQTHDLLESLVAP